MTLDTALKIGAPHAADGPLLVWRPDGPYFRNFKAEYGSITVAGTELRFVGLRDAADLLDEPDFAARFLDEDIAPYGLELWPAAPMLAEFLLTGEPGGGRSAVELGCGLGLVSIAAARMGWRITATDNDPMALQFARFNAALNHAPGIEFVSLDWHHPPPTRRFDRVFGADVLYQPFDHIPILRWIAAALAGNGHALLADPNRTVADVFEARARETGFEVQVFSIKSINARGRSVDGRIFRLRLPA